MESKTGFILTLIGAIIGVLVAIFILLLGIGGATMMGILGNSFGVPGMAWTGIVWIFMGVLYLVFAIMTFVAAFMMKKPDKVKTGGILAIIFGVVGSNIFALIGGILALVDANK